MDFLSINNRERIPEELKSQFKTVLDIILLDGCSLKGNNNALYKVGKNIAFRAI